MADDTGDNTPAPQPVVPLSTPATSMSKPSVPVNPTIQPLQNNIPSPSQPQIVDTSNHLQRLYEQGGLLTIDEGVQVTGVLQENKYFELVGNSTPTASATTTHYRVWYSTTNSNQLCGIDSTGKISCGFNKMVQTVQGISTASDSTTSATFVNTSLNVTIQLRSTSDSVLLICHSTLVAETQGVPAYTTFARGSTNLGPSNGFIKALSSTGGLTEWPMAMMWLDGPSLTGNVTYNVQFKSDGSHTADFNIPSNTAVIEAIEIAP